jgi:hypothetical protein
LTARATDGAGNTTSRSVGVTVANATGGDAAPPAIAIAAPTAGATVSGPITVTGQATDDTSVVSVEVAVDGGAYAPASGTTSWARGIDTRSYADGPHSISARATDAAGKVQVTTTTATFANGSPPTGSDTVLHDPSSTNALTPLGRSKVASWGSLTGVLATEEWTNRKLLLVRDATNGATSAVTLPSDHGNGWSNAAAVMTSADELWVLGGIGPVWIRQYRLSGGPLPTAASLLSSRQVGDTDSRPGDLLRLTDGGLVAVWHQQGRQGPEGLHVAHRTPGGSWSQLPALTFTNTMSSNQSLAQHPADGGVWLFHNADTGGRIDAVRFTVGATGLAVTDQLPSFITPSVHGLNGPDPENPVLAAAVDPVARTLHLAYQSADRRYFGSGAQLMAGSRVAVATVGPSGQLAFDRAPVWAERVSPIGLSIVAGEPVVSYLPVDEATLTATRIEVVRRRGGAWTTPVVFGEKAADTPGFTYGVGRAEVVTKLVDGRIHLRTF